MLEAIQDSLEVPAERAGRVRLAERESSDVPVARETLVRGVGLEIVDLLGFPGQRET